MCSLSLLGWIVGPGPVWFEFGKLPVVNSDRDVFLVSETVDVGSEVCSLKPSIKS